MHEVTAATVAIGGGPQRPSCFRGWPRDPRWGRSRSASAAPALTSTPRSCAADAAERLGHGSSGRKSFVTSGGHADVIPASCCRAPTARASTAIAVDARRAGRRASRERGRASGWRATRASRLDLDDVAVDDDARIGAPGAAADLVFGAVAPYVPGRPRRGQRRHRGRRRRRAATRARGRRAATRTAPRWRRCSTCSTRSRTWTSLCGRRGCLFARRPELGDAGDESALVVVMEAKVAPRPRRPRPLPKRLCRSHGRPGIHACASGRAVSARRARRVGDGADERGPAQLDRQGARGASGSMSDPDSPRSARSHTTRGSSRSGSVSATYFADAGVPTDYVLYSNYERHVEALLDGDVDIAWNTNTASWPPSRGSAETARMLGMRDIDAEFRTVIVTRRGERSGRSSELGGQASRARQPRLGPRRDPPAALPRGAGRRRGAASSSASTPTSASTATPATPRSGSSRRSPRATPTRAPSATPMWAAFRAGPSGRGRALGRLALAHLLPLQLHRAADVSTRSAVSAWRGALLAMSYDDTTLRPAMDLESVKRWLPGDREGYER